MEVVDSVGAGDTFNAAFIAAIMNGANIKKALETAVFIATEKCTMRSAFTYSSPSSMQEIESNLFTILFLCFLCCYK